MHTKFLTSYMKILLAILSITLPVIELLVADRSVLAQQNQPRILASPYYGNTSVISWFDHRFPNYTTDNHLLKYTGEERDDPHDEIPGPPVEDLACDQDAIFDNCYDGHDGIDFDLHYEQVLASSAGTVSKAGWDVTNCHNGGACNYGLVVEIQHEIAGTIFRTRYGHLTTIGVEVGQYIKASQVIGTSGSTGNSSGPHLHFDVYICIHATCSLQADWRAIDPFGWESEPGNDPWPTNGGHESWCMWSKGQWANICDENLSDLPIYMPNYATEVIIDDNLSNSGGFSKGSGGAPFTNTCTGESPNCEKWWHVDWAGIEGDAFRTIASGTTPTTWAGWFPDLSNTPYGALYEIFVFVPELNGPTLPNNTFTWQATYKIFDMNYNFHTAVVDQYIGTGQNYNPHDRWLSIGVYPLNNLSYVYITDNTGEVPNTHCPGGPFWPLNGTARWCRMTIDAVKFSQIQYRIFLPFTRNFYIPSDNDPPPGPSPTPSLTPSPTPTRTPIPSTPYP